VGVPLVAAFLLDQSERLRPHATRLLSAGVVIAFVVEQLTLYWIVAHRFTVSASGPVLYFLDPQWAPRVAASVLLGAFVLALGWLAAAVGQQAAMLRVPRRASRARATRSRPSPSPPAGG
jgi:hypothetical protein